MLFKGLSEFCLLSTVASWRCFPSQEFLDASLPCQLEVASSLLMADRFAAARAACEDRLQRWRHGTWPQRRLSGGNSVGRVRPNEKRLVKTCSTDGKQWNSKGLFRCDLYPAPEALRDPFHQLLRADPGRYHSLLLQGGRTVAVGLNGQGESSVPCLGRSLRYVSWQYSIFTLWHVGSVLVARFRFTESHTHRRTKNSVNSCSL